MTRWSRWMTVLQASGLALTLSCADRLPVGSPSPPPDESAPQKTSPPNPEPTPVEREGGTAEPGNPGKPAEGEARLRGKVSAVDGEMGILILSVGEEDGVEVGERAGIFRGGRKIAEVQVERLLGDMSGARIVEKSEAVEEEDEVRFRVKK